MKFPVLVIAILLGFTLAWAEPSADLLTQANAQDEALQAATALKLYQQLEVADPNNVDVLLGIARQYRHLMADTPTPAEKLRLLSLAMDYSRRAEKLAPDNAETHLAVAITYAKRVPLLSSKDQITTSRLLRNELDQTLALDAKSDLAWHLLGRWSEGYADLSSVRRTMGEMLYGKLPTATHEEAAACFQKAIAANPSRLMHYIELGRVYAAMGRKDEARKFIKKGLAMPSHEKDDPDYKKRGAETLATLK